MNSEEKKRIIFICNHNSARSQIAEAFLKDFGMDYFKVSSAGIEGTSINPLTVKVMEELNYDLSEQYSKSVSDFTDKMQFDIMITVCAKAEKKCPTLPGVETKLHWDFDNPSDVKGSEEEKLEAFRIIRDKIKEKILEWLKDQGIRPEV